jgi:hypothetical protein
MMARIDPDFLMLPISKETEVDLGRRVRCDLKH